MIRDKGAKTADKRKKKVGTKRKHKNEISREIIAPVDTVDIPHEECEVKIKDKHKQNNIQSNPDQVNKKSKPLDDTDMYPILKDENFIQKIHSVPLTNNQKGRIRQNLKDNLKGTSECLLPDIIHNKIQALLKNSETYSDADLRKMRILFNMLKTAAQINISNTQKVPEKDDSKKALKKKKKVKDKSDLNSIKEDVNLEEDNKQKENNIVPKKKGPKRYVVFVGNLPMDVDKEKIIQHFADIKTFIKDVRLPKQKEGKSAIAYVELENETIYELALSKHHSMFGNKRINVLYTTQKNGKITKTEAKSKTAKLVALQKSGKLAGSIPMNRKRSQRRLKMKKAQAKLAAESA